MAAFSLFVDEVNFTFSTFYFPGLVYLRNMKFTFIAVEGNIGSGKTTLANELADYYSADIVLEQFTDNPFLPQFYKEKARYALPVELSFLTDRYQQLNDYFSSHKKDDSLLIADYAIAKTELFARTNLNETEFQLFERILAVVKTNLPKPDLLIYLHAPVAKLQKQIRNRGRSFEQNISDEYLDAISKAYQHYLAKAGLKTLWVDTAIVDLTKEADFKKLIAILESENGWSDEGFRFL